MDWRCEGFFFPQMYHRSALRMRAQCHGQVRELMENYGRVDVLWYDGGEDYWLAHGRHLNNGSEENFREHPLIDNFWGEAELNEMVRRAQPSIVVNNRLGMRRRPAAPAGRGSVQRRCILPDRRGKTGMAL